MSISLFLIKFLFPCCCSSLTGDLPSVDRLAGFAAVYVCCCSSLTGDLPSAVWPAGFAAVCMCCGSFLTGDLLSHNIILLFLFHVLAGYQGQYFPESMPWQQENTV